MANRAQAVAENVPGEFFVDRTCIDCDTCRQLAPQVFGAVGDYSYVHTQPRDEESQRHALHALLACPTGSIGASAAKPALVAAMDDFPLLVEEPVRYCGFTSEDSFGGSSYFVTHPAGNWLVDSPRFTSHLVKKFEQAGGIANVFLTHQDDVADAEKYARHFGARRIIHRAELAAQPAAELIIEGNEAQLLGDDFLAIPTPGHTRGHVVLLFAQRFLFTGDHLWWARDELRLGASQRHCWYSWPRQIESLRRLLDYSFAWVLPGHGDRVQLPPAEMRQQLANLVARM
jgi:glyoxylase-like metal-dependent hydrolase (beta-lactamase superfamily II)/ferredoxin